MWTEETIEALRRLASEGRSASVIAAALGATSRNAVIGKANRIGIKLNGGGNSAAPRKPREGAGRPRLVAVPRAEPSPRKRTHVPALPRERELRPQWIFAQAEVGEMRRIGLEEIREVSCRWPLGDPMGEDFAYCGLQVATGRSYCAGHCRMAYRPPTVRPEGKAA